MKHVSLAEAAPGMVLAKPAKNLKGMVVLPVGTILTDALLARLHNQKLAGLTIESDDGEAPSPPKSLSELEQELDQRFRKVHNDPLQDQIRETIRQHLRATHRGQTAQQETAP